MDHVDKKYQEKSLGDLSKDFPAKPATGKNLVWDVTGLCPECKVEVTRRFKQEVVFKMAAAPKDLDPNRLHTMRCDCGMAHDGRDETKDVGCGAYWKIRL